MKKSATIRIDADEKPERELTAYRFDRQTGVFCGQRQVRGERYGSGETVYRLRPFETMEEPPILEDGEVAVFSERTRTWGLRRWRVGDPAEVAP